MIKIDPKVILIGVVLFLGYKHKDDINIKVPDFLNQKPAIVQTTERTVNEPSAELKTLVQPIIQALKNGGTNRDKIADAYLFGDFYGDFAEIIIKADIIKTNKALRENSEIVGKLIFDGKDLSNAYPGLKEATTGQNGAISKFIGLEAGQADLTKQYNIYKAIQWAAYEAVK